MKKLLLSVLLLEEFTMIKKIKYSLYVFAMISLIVSSLSFAAPPANPQEQSIPVQLTLVRTALAEMKVQIQENQDALLGEIAKVQTTVGGNKDNWIFAIRYFSKLVPAGYLTSAGWA